MKKKRQRKIILGLRELITALINIIKHDGQITLIMNNRLFDNIIYLIFRSEMSPMEHHGNALQKYDSNGKYKEKTRINAIIKRKYITILRRSNLKYDENDI